MNYYILIEKCDNGTFFSVSVDQYGRETMHYYEIYMLSPEQRENIISLLHVTAPIIVEAQDQMAAFKKLSPDAKESNIYKYADKPYYESYLPLKV